MNLAMQLAILLITLSISLSAMAAFTINLVKDINPGTDWSQPFRFTAVGSTVFLFAKDGVHDNEL